MQGTLTKDNVKSTEFESWMQSINPPITFKVQLIVDGLVKSNMSYHSGAHPDMAVPPFDSVF